MKFLHFNFNAYLCAIKAVGQSVADTIMVQEESPGNIEHPTF